MIRSECCIEESPLGARDAEAFLVQLAPASGGALCARLSAHALGLHVLNRATDAVLVVVEGDGAERRRLRNEIENWPEVRQISSVFAAR